jgi:methionine synthase I (cobalamin-dependent)
MTTAQSTDKPGLLECLAAGPVLCAEGYLFELERRGYLQAGAFVPEVIVEHPEAVLQLHREFVNAGSDVVEALTYYAHREKLRIVGRDGQLEAMNRQALGLAREVADESGMLFAGNICNTNLYNPEDEAAKSSVRAIFEEQVGWAADAGVDFVIAETFAWAGEAELALDVLESAGVPAVVTFAIHKQGTTREGYSPADACRRLEDGGADVVGLNCALGPATMLPALKAVRAAVKGHVAALPVPYRTTPEEPTFQALSDPQGHSFPGDRPFPTALDPFVCSRYEMADFAREALALGVRYLGICCGAGPHHVRAMAEALGRRPPASRYSPDMSKHYSLGTDPSLKGHNQAFAKDL